jgi:signal transduction histidine kinase
MRWRQTAVSWDRKHPVFVDLALVVTLLALSVVFTAGTASLMAWNITMTLPLAARRSRPVASAVVVFGVAAAHLSTWLTQWSPGTGITPVSGDLMVLVSLYSVTMYGPRWAYRTAAAGSLAGAAIVGGGVTTVTAAPRVGIIAAMMIGLSSMAVFAFALARRSRLEQLDALTERARRLEAERDQQVASGAATERARIAREMHDIVAHSLSVIIAQADGGRYSPEPDAAQRSLSTIAETGRAALADMRGLLGVLRTDSTSADGAVDLRPQPATEQLNELVEQVRSSGLPVSLVRVGTARPLPPGTGLAIYRICQEALTNVLKHAGPQARATVLLKWSDTDLMLEITDDGRGAAAQDDGSGGGVLGMRERAAMLGGMLVAGPRPGGGFRVRAQIPGPGSLATDVRNEPGSEKP